MNETFRAGGPQLCTVPVDTESIAPAHLSYQFMNNSIERLTGTIMPLLTKAGVRSPKCLLFSALVNLYLRERARTDPDFVCGSGKDSVRQYLAQCEQRNIRFLSARKTSLSAPSK